MVWTRIVLIASAENGGVILGPCLLCQLTRKRMLAFLTRGSMHHGMNTAQCWHATSQRTITISISNKMIVRACPLILPSVANMPTFSMCASVNCMISIYMPVHFSHSLSITTPQHQNVFNQGQATATLSKGLIQQIMAPSVVT
jgi:hypothetical protein